MHVPVKWRGRQPALTPEQLAEALEYRRLLEIAGTVPSTADLAARWGVSQETVRCYLRGDLPKRMAHAARG
jgi:hypothetical protein